MDQHATLKNRRTYRQQAFTDSCQTEIGSGKISNDEIAVINLFNLPPSLPHALLQLYVVLYSGDRLTLKNVRSGFL